VTIQSKRNTVFSGETGETMRKEHLDEGEEHTWLQLEKEGIVRLPF